jgi:hypothetical protein
MQGNVSATSVRPDRHLVFPMAPTPRVSMAHDQEIRTGGCGRLTRGVRSLHVTLYEGDDCHLIRRGNGLRPMKKPCDGLPDRESALGSGAPWC